jgi:hypothetical protein
MNLLQGVNEVLKRTNSLDLGSPLTSLTDQSKQGWIDLAVQIWNEMVDQIYTETGTPRPTVLEEDVISLAEGVRTYPLAYDLVRLHFPLHDETNGWFITEYPGGYMSLVTSQPQPENHTGLPLCAAIRPDTGELYLDRIPTENEDELLYKYRYEKDLVLTFATDEFPFSDAVFRALVPAVAQLWKRERKGPESFDGGVFRQSYGRACRMLRQLPPRESYRPMYSPNETDPFSG